MATAPTTNVSTAVATGRAGRPMDGLRQSPSTPRDRSRCALSVMTIRMSTNGTPSPRPCWGSQVNTVCSLTISDWITPSSRPAAAVTPNEENRPISAAPRAGTTNSV